jgi:antitoxin (DNA-binding transcriptional repressor) of toxin-antitoxin stability system
MKQVSIQELKKHLSRWVDEAAGGERIVITRYHRPVAQLGSVAVAGLRVGSRHGTGIPGPLFDRATNGRFLEVLEEDRGER